MKPRTGNAGFKSAPGNTDGTDKTNGIFKIGVIRGKNGMTGFAVL